MDMLSNTSSGQNNVATPLMENDATSTKKLSKSATQRQAAERIGMEMKVFQGIVEEVHGKVRTTGAFETRCKLVVDCATEFFGAAPTWTAFYREALGKSGIAHSVFPDAAGYEAFCDSPEYMQLLEMLTALRAKNLPENDPTESQKMITIRLPLSLHDTICCEANELGVSVNMLCITRMLQPLAAEMMPQSSKKRRGRRPGARYEDAIAGSSKPHSSTEIASDS